MLAMRLVRLIESHSDRLAAGLLERLLASQRTSDLRKVPREELRERTYEIYRNLSEWLIDKTEAELERRYTELGERRARQGVALSHLIAALFATKEHLLEYLQTEGYVDRPAELFGEIELLLLLDQFFDRAVYFTAAAYERVGVAHAA